MQNYKSEFIQYALQTGVLTFGQFRLKSGRLSPYFFNTGLFNNGARLARLGEFYAATLIQADVQFDALYGPAYKGIPLVASTAIALSISYQRSVPWCFNRKEAKHHGEAGQLVGAPLSGRVVIVDDVISAGTSVRESVPIIRAENAEATAVLIALDRQEVGSNNRSAIDEIQSSLGLQVVPIIKLEDLIKYLQAQPGQQEQLEAIERYLIQYGTQ